MLLLGRAVSNWLELSRRTEGYVLGDWMSTYMPVISHSRTQAWLSYRVVHPIRQCSSRNQNNQVSTSLFLENISSVVAINTRKRAVNKPTTRNKHKPFINRVVTSSRLHLVNFYIKNSLLHQHLHHIKERAHEIGTVWIAGVGHVVR